MGENRYTVEKITELLGRKLALPEYRIRDTRYGNVFRCDSAADADWLADVLNEREENVGTTESN